MSGIVTIQPAGCGEGHWAVWTLVRSITSVGEGVRLECYGRSKVLLAMLALVGSLTCI